MAERRGLTQLLSDLGGRSVWQVLILYLGASWGVLEVVDVLKDNMGLPDWVFPFAVVLLLIGLPVMLGTAAIQARYAAGVGSAGRSPEPQPSTNGEAKLVEAASDDAEEEADLAPHRLFTWRNALLGGAAAFVLLTLVTTGFMFMRNRGIGPVGSLVAKGLIDERSEILVADFDAADEMLGRMASEALRVDLSQSDIVRLVSPRTVEGALDRMQLARGTRLDEGTAREIAEREGLPAVVGGEILSGGGSFVITAHIVTPDGDLLGNARVTAADSSKIIDAIDRLSRDLREQIGESYSSLRASPPLAEVSTSSVEALRKYTEAGVQRSEGNLDAAIALLEDAIGIDSTFAMAYRGIGIFLQNKYADFSRQVWAHSKAYEYRDRLTEREKWLVTASYYLDVEEDPSQAIAAYENVLQVDPDMMSAVNNIGVIYYFQMDWDKALAQYLKANEMEPSGLTASNVGAVYANLGQLDEADEWINRAIELEPGNPSWKRYRVHLAQLRGNDAEARRLNEELRRERSADPYWLERTYELEFLLDAEDGRLAEARSSLREAVRAGAEEGPADGLAVSLNAAELSLALGDPGLAARQVESALDEYPLESIPALDRPAWAAASILARSGRPDEARRLLEGQRAELGPVADRHQLHFDIAEAWIDVAEGRAEEAIPVLRGADGGYACEPCADHAVATAFDRAGQPDSAVAYYEKYLEPVQLWRAWVDGTWRGWTLERLGQLYDELGEPDKAAGYYGMFVDLWADADPELQPRVEAARARMEEIVRERG